MEVISENTTTVHERTFDLHEVLGALGIEDERLQAAEVINATELRLVTRTDHHQGEHGVFPQQAKTSRPPARKG